MPNIDTDRVAAVKRYLEREFPGKVIADGGEGRTAFERDVHWFRVGDDRAAPLMLISFEFLSANPAPAIEPRLAAFDVARDLRGMDRVQMLIVTTEGCRLEPRPI